jgi:hypothetical protein
VPDINDDAPDSIQLKAALDSKRDVLAAMPPEEVTAMPRLDASAATGIVIGSLPRIAEHRAEVVAQFGDPAAALLDDLPVIAYASEQANIELVAADSASDLSAVHEQVLEDHKLLVTDADALGNRKLIDPQRIDAGRPIQGYRTTVTSVLVLVALLREHWPVISGKTPLTTADLDRIEARAQRMLQRLNERDQGSNRIPAVEMRVRAFSMLMKSYGEVRRMLTYVRWWQEDADTIAPSLWSGRRGRGRAEEDDEVVVEAVVEAAPTPGAPAPTGNGGPFTS